MGSMDGFLSAAFGMLPDWISTGTYDVFRPDYTSKTSAARTIARSVNLMVNVKGTADEARLHGVELYHIGYKRLELNLQVGDMIFPAANTPTGVERPIVTIKMCDANKPTIAVRTNRLGKIFDHADDVDSPEFDNVYFDFHGSTGPGPAPVSEMADSDTVQNVSKASVVIYQRPGIIRPGWKLYENATGLTYTVQQINGVGPLVSWQVEVTEQ